MILSSAPGSRDHFQRFYREYRGATFDDDSSSSGGSSSSESGDEGDSSDEDNEDETKEGSASPQLKQHLTHQNNSSDHAKRKNDNSEIDDYLMELDGKWTAIYFYKVLFRDLIFLIHFVLLYF